MRGQRWVIISTLASAVGCRAIVGLDDRDPSPRAVDAGVADARDPLAFLPAACGTCVESSCASAMTTCKGDPACRRYAGCLALCAGDAQCRSQCVVESRWPQYDAVLGLDVCLADKCAEPCAITCGGLGAVAPPSKAADCDRCLVGKLCSDATACARDAACARELACQLACRTDDCSLACAKDPTTTFLTKAMDSCSADCGAGSYWSCVGTVSWPRAKSSSIEVTVTVVDILSQTPVEGVRVRACINGDITCDSALASEVSKADGKLVLKIAVTGSQPFDGYFEASKEGAVTTLNFPLPISEPKWNALALTGSKALLDAVVKFAGVTSDPARGILFAQASDCLNNPSAGVVFEATTKDAGSTAFYIRDKRPDTSLKATEGTTGSGGFMNLPPTALELSMHLLDDPKVLGKRGVFVRAGGVTNVILAPTP